MPVDPGGAIPMMVRRLDGIESELRELRSLMAQLVRVEERGNADRAEVGRLAVEVATQRRELGALRDRAARSGFTVGIVERAAWLLLAAAVAWASTLWGK